MKAYAIYADNRVTAIVSEERLLETLDRMVDVYGGVYVEKYSKTV